MNRLVRGIARSRIAERAVPAHTLVISQEDGYIVLRRDHLTLRLPENGHPTVNRQNPAHPTVRAGVSHQRLVIRGRTDDGRRRATYGVMPNDHLRLTVKIEASRLPAPVDYHLTYRRSS